MGFLDDLLPIVILEFIEMFMRFIFILITAVVANPWLIIAAVAVILALFLFRWYYLKTARDVKRLEAIGMH